MHERLSDEIHKPGLNSLRQLEYAEFSRLLDEHLIRSAPKSTSLEPNACFLITLSFSSLNYNRLLTHFPNGKLDMSLNMAFIESPRLSVGRSQELFKQDVPISFDLFENLAQMGNSSTYLLSKLTRLLTF